MFLGSRILMDDADAAPGGDPVSAPAVTPADKEAVEKLAAMEKKIAAAEKREAERKRKEQEAADAKRIADGETKAVLAETQAKLAAAQERLAAIEAAEAERAEKLFASLPEARRKALSVVKDSLPAEKWAALLAAESETVAATTAPHGDDEQKTVLPPPTGAPMAESRKNRDNYTPTPQATELLEQLGHGDDMLRRLRKSVETDGEGPATYKFHMSFKDWIEHMPKRQSAQISLINAAKRDS